MKCSSCLPAALCILFVLSHFNWDTNYHHLFCCAWGIQYFPLVDVSLSNNITELLSKTFLLCRDSGPCPLNCYHQEQSVLKIFEFHKNLPETVLQLLKLLRNPGRPADPRQHNCVNLLSLGIPDKTLHLALLCCECNISRFIISATGYLLLPAP